MILDNKNILKLKKLGLLIRYDNNTLFFTITEDNIINKSHLNYLQNPRLDLKKIDNHFQITHWDYAPGPGPGDFILDFESEIEVVSFIESYYFGSNPYREILRKYINNHRESYNVKDVEHIFQKIIQTIKTKFGENEIDFNERGSYHKIKIDDWNITEAKPENISIYVGWGYLNHE